MPREELGSFSLNVLFFLRCSPDARYVGRPGHIAVCHAERGRSSRYRYGTQGGRVGGVREQIFMEEFGPTGILIRSGCADGGRKKLQHPVSVSRANGPAPALCLAAVQLACSANSIKTAGY
ncbi:hypothetical protein RRG08_061261 [Elysia crispata]|uniref:Uncharacterized protein n=1 Tax=Elysia crispata TaxID=231223 RepID=A0AAE0ZGB5_9GAST|nr:hypothetical protein RRG08_061261 [Elysia crispata]